MINLVIALPAEARPLIAHWQLKMLSQETFPVYGNENMRLIISGVGSAAAKQAVDYLHPTNQSHNAAWLNIGLAGHATAAIGSARLAHKISDTQRQWYPPRVLKFDLPSEALITVTTPETDYKENTLYDMEASSFYSAATRYSSAELVQVFKVISDNRTNHHNKINAKIMSQLIEPHIQTLASIISTLQEKVSQINRITFTPYYETCLQRWHFTVTQQHQLSRLLKQYAVLSPKANADFLTQGKFSKAEQLLNFLSKEIATLSQQHQLAHD